MQTACTTMASFIVYTIEPKQNGDGGARTHGRSWGVLSPRLTRTARARQAFERPMRLMRKKNAAA